MKTLTRTLPLALCLAATPMLAQDGTGSITGTLDLDDARWTVASAGPGPTSAFAETDDFTAIRLVGQPETGSDGGAGTLLIEIAASVGAEEVEAEDVRIGLLRGGETLVALSENIDLTITSYLPEASDLAISGSFTALMTEAPQDDLIIDSESGVTIDGNFQATIPRVDNRDSATE